MMDVKEKKRDIVTQLVDGIIGKEKDLPKTTGEKAQHEETRQRLSGRAWEYLMFMDDEDE